IRWLKQFSIDTSKTPRVQLKHLAFSKNALLRLAFALRWTATPRGAFERLAIFGIASRFALSAQLRLARFESPRDVLKRTATPCVLV
ncbi:hypothetical protein A2U01_0073712, partial [Trifolium medium]|nr:hypothetical protein [Trifolium medium]